MTKLVSVGIVTWNSSKDLPTCLASLARQDHADFELIVVDNGSTDDSLAIVRGSFPAATVIVNPQNRGFCGGHNQAIAAAKGEFYLPLNPDVELEPDYLGKALEAMASGPNVGSVATLLFLGTRSDTPRRIDSTGLFIDRKRRQHLRGFHEIDHGQYRRMEEVFGVDGAAPLYRRAMLEDVRIDGQYFDEAFFSHKEDVDLSWRARILGWRCIYTPFAMAYHRRTFRPLVGVRKLIDAETKVHAVKNRYLLLLKNEGPAGLRRDFWRIACYDLELMAYLLLFERSSLVALSRIRQTWTRTMRWRREIRGRARVSPGDETAWFAPPRREG
jgi:GT2 family glycosyltransferase